MICSDFRNVTRSGNDHELPKTRKIDGIIGNFAGTGGTIFINSYVNVDAISDDTKLIQARGGSFRFSNPNNVKEEYLRFSNGGGRVFINMLNPMQNSKLLDESLIKKITHKINTNCFTNDNLIYGLYIPNSGTIQIDYNNKTRLLMRSEYGAMKIGSSELKIAYTRFGLGRQTNCTLFNESFSEESESKIQNINNIGFGEEANPVYNQTSSSYNSSSSLNGQIEIEISNSNVNWYYTQFTGISLKIFQNSIVHLVRTDLNFYEKMGFGNLIKEKEDLSLYQDSYETT